jgi:hypothetical protein
MNDEIEFAVLWPQGRVEFRSAPPDRLRELIHQVVPDATPRQTGITSPWTMWDADVYLPEMPYNPVTEAVIGVGIGYYPGHDWRGPCAVTMNENKRGVTPTMPVPAQEQILAWAMPALTHETEHPAAEVVLAAGLRWLFDTEQPEGSVLEHHGVVLRAAGNRQFGFVPAGWAGHAIVTVDVAEVRWAYGANQLPANPLRPGELEDRAALLAALGAEVVRTWNGHPSITGSLALARPAHPSLLAAVDRYRAGCLTHPGTLCKCGWYAAGFELVIQPDVSDDRARPATEDAGE